MSLSTRRAALPQPYEGETEHVATARSATPSGVTTGAAAEKARSKAATRDRIIEGCLFPGLSSVRIDCYNGMVSVYGTMRVSVVVWTSVPAVLVTVSV
jgi:hypothetical protein